jgi:P-type Ca2+ transporter type 2C
LSTGMTCSHATIERDEHGWRLLGEPTEGALVVAAYKAWLPTERPRAVSELSFDSTRKRMAIVTRDNDRLTAHVKGAPEVIVARCTRLLDGERVRDLTDADRDALRRAVKAMTHDGLRVLALARRDLVESTPMTEDEVERDLTLLGVAGIIDPPRPEVPAAIATAAKAGIRVVMITGDAGETGLAVARQVGLDSPGYLTGGQVDTMDGQALEEALYAGMVFARTTPEHKMRIVEALQRRGEVCAMTGDGVNDAPSLREADVGIAMGIRGTDAAKGAADMVLTDDNFASIVGAVEEGRRQNDNIRKFIGYLLSSNLAEVTAIAVNILMGGPLMLLPVQILWMNLITDGVTALALGVEPAEANVMSRPPRRGDDGPLTRHSLVPVAVLGGYMAAATVVLFHLYLPNGDPGSVGVAQTVAFTAIIVFEKVNVLNFRSLEAPLVRISPWSNPWLIAAIIAMLGLQALAVYVPFLQEALHTTALGVEDWLVIVAFALPVPVIGEVLKRSGVGRASACRARA